MTVINPQLHHCGPCHSHGYGQTPYKFQDPRIEEDVLEIVNDPLTITSTSGRCTGVTDTLTSCATATGTFGFSMHNLFPLTDQEIRNWLGAVGLCADELSRINYSLDFHQERLQDLVFQIASVLDPAGGNKSGFCGLAVRTTRKRTKGLKALYTSEETMTKSINNLRSLLSPIRRLPQEILMEIFKWCTPQEQFTRPDLNQGPLLLIQVCRAWRKACLANPLFWTSLEVTDKHIDYRMRDPRTATFIGTWFSRSGVLPLSLSIQGDNISNDSVIDTVARFSGRWRNLRIHVPSPQISCLPPENHYPRLESIEIHTHDGLEHYQMVDLSKALLKAPKLSRFTWHNHQRQSTHLELNWDNLTRLILNTSVDVDQCVTIMSMLGPVTHLTFQDIRMSNPIMPRRDITLPELTSFVVCAEYSISYMFEQVTMPKLKELVLNLHYWPHESVVGFFQRSRCPLESLNLYFPPLQEQELIECLECVQNSLKEFTVQKNHGSFCVTDTVLDRLTDTGTGSVLCPNVAVMALYDCIYCSPGRFTSMIQSRLPKPEESIVQGVEAALPQITQEISPIRVVELYDSETELEYLKPLRKQGLVLKIYSSLDGTAIDMEPEEVERLMQLKEEGLVLRVYVPETGHFGEVSD